MESGKSFAVGETVLALWPGSRRYYEATVRGIRKNSVVVDFKKGFETEVPLRHAYKQGSKYFRSRSSSPARSRRRSSSPGRPRTRSRSRSRSPGRGRPRLSDHNLSEESPVQKVKQKKPVIVVTQQTRRSPKRDRTPRKRSVKETVSSTTTMSSGDSVRVMTTQTVTSTTTSSEDSVRVTRSVTKKLIAEQKESLAREPEKTSRGYEFGGPFGVFFMMIGLPVTVLSFYLFCNGNGPCTFLQKPSFYPPLWRYAGGFFDIGHLIVNGWIVLQVILYMLPVGKVVRGKPLADGTSLEYRTNGFFALAVSLLGFAACLYFKVPVTKVYDTFVGMITASFIWSVMISVGMYLLARHQKTGLSPGGNTGNVVYDFFMGHQLNPRCGLFDFKFFCEVRPGLIGWVMINFCMAVEEYEREGTVSTAMALVCIFHLLYVADCLWYESSMVTTMDILEEGFGFMLAFGDISWVPFMYSLQSRYLVDHPMKMHWSTTAATVALFVIGYVIFRGANSEKDRFKTDPNSAEFQDRETILTPSGHRLLVSGFWGLVRHPNYLGDIIMAFAWTIPCGFTNPIPFFYPIYLTILLCHRELRDEASNRRKYGDCWDEYCRRVPYRILPKVF